MIAPKVMVVEDEEPLGVLLRYNLESEGYQVEVVTRGDEAEIRLQENVPDLLVLDWMVPALSGIELCRRLRMRPETERLPIIMLTARGEESDRVRGLSTGADDYLVKPFSFTELVLRIRTLLRRGVIRESDVFEIADLKLDVLRRKVTREGVEIALTNKEFMLLHLLVRRQGEALSRTQIASEVWDMNFDSDTNVVDVAIKRLRAKVDHPFEKKLIHTVRSIGYTFGDGS